MKKYLYLLCIFFSFSLHAQLNLPVDFESASTTYFTDFGGNMSSVVADPTNPNNMVAMSQRQITAETWAGTTIGTGGFTTQIPFAANATRISMKVYSNFPGTPIHMKAEDLTDPNIFVETRMYTTKTNTWETIVFDFNNPVHGSPALNLNTSYYKLSVFFDFGAPGIASGQRDYYWDDVVMGGTSTTLAQLDLPVSFEQSGVSYAMVDFEGNSTTIGADPVDQAQTVAITTKTDVSSTWSGTVIGTRNGFVNTIPFSASETTITARVYSPAANIPILLKAEKASDPTNHVETIQYTSKANEWETITWNFAQHSPNTPALNLNVDYDLLAIFFNFGVDGATSGAQTFYWDNVSFGPFTSTNVVESNNISLYPNPVGDQFRIETPEPINAVEIYNISGQLVFTAYNLNDFPSIRIGHLNSGIYVLKAMADEVTYTSKLVKQ